MASEILLPQGGVINPLIIHGFRVKIHKIPELQFWVKECTLPNVTLSHPEIATPFKRLHAVSDTIEYGDLDVSFLVDEKMNNYEALLEWAQLVSFDENYDQVNQWRNKWFNPSTTGDSDELLVSDITVQVIGSNDKVIRSFDLTKAIITSLGAITMNDDATETQYMTVSATFKICGFRMSEVLQ